MKTETKTGASSERIANLSPSKLELLARRLREKEGREQGRARIPRRAGSGRDSHAPLSFDQERLWFIDQLETNHAVNNAPDGLVLEGRLRMAALEQALGEVVRRHEILRTTFQMSGGEPVQVVAPVSPLKLPLIDLGGLPAGERQECVRRLAEAEERRRFDLARGPLLRTALLRLDEGTHILLLTAHHTVCDAWSMSVLNRELAGLYQAYVQGAPSTLAELPIQFSDFAAWQRENLQGEPLKRLLDYWHKQLAGAPAVLDLPTDMPRPALQNYRGAAESLELSETLSQSLQSLSRESGVTLFMTMLAAFKVLLGGYSGARDIVVGTPVGGRNQLETEPLIGLFINTLVMRTDLGGDPTFRELLGRVSEVTLGALAHRELPFERLVYDLQPVRALSHTPLFQVMFDLQRPVSVATSLPGLGVRPLGSPSQFAKFDLSMYVNEKPDRLTLTLQYNTELFEAETVRKMLGHTRNLLESVVADPRRRLSQLSLLDADERRRILVDWNETEKDYGAPSALHELFEAQAARTPDHAALIFEGESLTYDELNRRANRLANFLRAEGVAPDALVAVCAERSFEMVVALLAVLKAGGAYLPLDPEYPSERLAFMLSDAQAPLLLTQQRLLSSLPPTEAHLVLLDADDTHVAGHSDENPANVVTGRNLAYVIYTSGSTGRPKGAMIHHEGLCNRLLWMQEQYGLDADDRVLQKTPFSFDVSGWEFFWPLITGATLVVAKPEGHRDPAYLLELIRRERVTTVHFVPSMLAIFLEQDDLETLSGLRRVICSGEALSYELQERFFARLGGVELHNLYGPTEASIDVTYWQCRAGEGARGGVPIGSPIANTGMYVLDGHLAPVPVGASGELYIGGIGLGRGYLNRPALTAERFVPHPHSKLAGARLYRTGDVGRHRRDAKIVYLGRTDHQVKVRGFRIELGEIESALTGQPSVREAIVAAEKDAAGGTRLVAYLVCEKEGEAADIEELRRSLKERLPEYMVPSAFAFVAEMPLSPNGKVDRRALAAAGAVGAEPTRVYLAPHTEAEQGIAAVWQETLKVEKVGTADNFFDLGGHSLSLVQVHMKLRAIFKGREFSVIDLFRFPTVGGLARFLSPTEDEEEAATRAQEQEVAKLTEGRDRLRRLNRRRQTGING
jgi:amino acid adenylation domain-containing protein